MRYLILLCFVLLLAVVPVLAQQNCPVVVQQALQTLGNNCSALERNSACYGYRRVQATFNEPVEENFFSQIADRAGLMDLQTLQTFPFDTTTNEWGIAVMNVQADLPNTLPGQAVTFLLLGDTQVQNAVAPEAAFQPVNPIDVITNGIANLRSVPDFNAPTTLTLPNGTTLPTDGRSEDQSFLRVVYQEQLMWVNATAVNGPEALNELPILRGSNRTAMQSFYFSNGLGEPGCTEAPSLLAIDTPEDLRVTLSVNGAEIVVGSLITFQTTQDGAVMTVIEGGVRNEDGLLISAGQASDLELDEDNNIVEWGEPRPITTEEFTAGQTVQQAMFSFRNPTVAGVDDGVCSFGETTTHTVAAGDNLFRIALRYNSTVIDIATLNNIGDVTSINVGQVLQIPCGTNQNGQGPMAGITQIPPLNVTVTAIPGATVCSGFRQTSPLGSYPNGATTFYWDGVATATNYRVLIFNQQGGFAAAFATQGNQTNVTGDMSPNTVGQGTTFTWAVEALLSGQTLCVTPGLTLARDQFAQGGTSVPGPSLSLSCPGSTSLILNWSNVTPGSVISWNLTSPGPLSGNVTSPGSSGSQFLTTPSPSMTYSGTASSTNPAVTQPVSVFCP